MPRIAAGNNLNLLVAGPLLRRGGAFFMRRKFAGDALYTAVFESYVDHLFTHGFAMEYFVEGGRSRKRPNAELALGDASHDVVAHNRLRRPLAFVPVHFSYERIIEGGSYLKELRGEKERESLLGLLRSARQFLRQRFGGVTVTFGEPLPLPAFLAQRPTAGPEDSATLRTLGATLLGRINAVAPANGIGRLALLFLAAPKARLREQQAIESLKTLEALLQNLPFAFQEHPGLEASALLARGEEDGLLERIEDPLGPVLRQRAAPYLLWYRNGLAHCVILPAVLLALVNRPRSEAYLEAAMTRLPAADPRLEASQGG